MQVENQKNALWAFLLTQLGDLTESERAMWQKTSPVSFRDLCLKLWAGGVFVLQQNHGTDLHISREESSFLAARLSVYIGRTVSVNFEVSK